MLTAISWELPAESTLNEVIFIEASQILSSLRAEQEHAIFGEVIVGVDVAHKI